jgi:hypothetical protein
VLNLRPEAVVAHFNAGRQAEGEMAPPHSDNDANQTQRHRQQNQNGLAAAVELQHQDAKNQHDGNQHAALQIMWKFLSHSSFSPEKVTWTPSEGVSV